MYRRATRTLSPGLFRGSAKDIPVLDLEPRTKRLRAVGGKASTGPPHVRPDAAHFVAERSEHPTQCSQWRSAGPLDVEMRVPVCPALVTWVLGFGSAVAVLGLVELVRRVAREHT